MLLTEEARYSELALNCIEKCLYCFVTCRTTCQNCVAGENPHHPLLRNIPLLQCAELCRDVRTFLERGSELWDVACSLCADLCESCARECKQVPDDEQFRICGEACEECAATCRLLVAAGAASSLPRRELYIPGDMLTE